MTTHNVSQERFEAGPPPFGGEEESSATESRRGNMVDRQTARLPTDTFLWLAGGSILGSLALKASGRGKDALFVGQWAPTFLLLGIYNKLNQQ